MKAYLMGVNPCAILVEDIFWVWTKAKVLEDMVKLDTFFGDEDNREMIYVPTAEDTQVEVEAPNLLLIPAGLIKWVLAGACTHGICTRK